MSWVKAASVNQLNGEPVVINLPPRQIVIVSVGDEIFAIDNRCPHEGYPLSVGTVTSDCVLTCNWHNWKFRLGDGECLVGGDHVRSYKTRVQDGEVWIDVTPPPPEEVEREVLRGLRSGFDERDFGRICREIARLDYEGLDPLNAVRAALEWSHDRVEFGATHAMAATADWLKLSLLWPDAREPRVVCLAEAVDHLAFDSLRHRAYPYPESGEPFTPAAFQGAIESEDLSGAEGMVRQGLADGLHWEDMEGAFVAAAFAHYNSFGHALIYVSKVGPMIE
jgi:nitrite reductase/ring-hydroxylating ferredoxin subunit